MTKPLSVIPKPSDFKPLVTTFKLDEEMKIVSFGRTDVVVQKRVATVIKQRLLPPPKIIDSNFVPQHMPSEKCLTCILTEKINKSMPQ